ncbi:hypothetical protein BDEG_20292 [Batrachochytrium dendrobatidis JEL423]|nr:hypothetical protein BDEG_20292 [Batrachochytrium dendrobatidis JEL423]
MDYCKNPTAVSSCLEREYSIPSAVQLSSPTFRPSIPVDSEPQTLLLSNEDGRLDPTSKPVESAIESLDMYGRDTCHDFYATLHGTSPRLSMSLHQHCLTQPKAQPSLHHQSMLGLENSNSTSALQPSIGLLTPFSQASELNRHVPATPFVTNSTRVDSYKQLYPGTSFTSSVCAAMSHLCACGAVMTLIQNRKVFCPSGHNSRLPPQAQEALDSSVLCTPTISGFIKTESRNCATLVSAPIMIHQSNSSIRHHDANPNSRTNRISNCTSSASPSASYANTLSKISTTTSIATDHLAQLGLSKRRVFGLLRHEMAIHSSARARMVL